MAQKLWMFWAGIEIAVILALNPEHHPVMAQPLDLVSSPTPPNHNEVCTIVNAMPDAEDTDELLTLLGTSRAETISNLIAMQGNMAQYNAEGYGWHHAIDGASALEPRPGAWMLGALSMVCEAQSASLPSLQRP